MQIPEIEIVVREDATELLRKTVRPGDYVIGRDAECEVQVEGERISGWHAQLIVNFDHVLVEDLGSDSGTFVNGKAVTEPTRLWPNQKIQIGGATIELRRVKTVQAPDVSLAPQTAAVQRLLPEEFLREKRYDIGGVVAQGGMGAILDARDTITERTVAMKVMLDGSNPGDLMRFVAEAKVTAQLEHPNIVPVHELGVDENDQVYYTMKYVKGVTLRKVFEDMAAEDEATLKKYPLPALLTIFQKVCDAIGFAHSKGVIHRDLKPENIMLGDFGEALVMDWGLAKRLGAGRNAESAGVEREPGATDATLSADLDTGSQTISGAILGTPQYMAPEQAEGRIEDMDARSDIFSLGGVLYAILTLRPPVEGKTLAEVLEKVVSGNITAPSAFEATTSKRKSSAKGGASAAKKIEPPVSAENETRVDEPQEDFSGGVTTPLSMGAATEAGSSSVKSKVLEARKITPLPHIPGGRVPAALSAVAMKALSLRKEDRYQTVAEFSADVAAYQTGFATKAEHASLMKQILLLIQRNKGIFMTGFAAWFVITALVVWFIINLRASERETRRQAEIAQQNEKRAEASAAEAKAEATRATAAEQSTKAALLKSALALAEAARREGNSPEMQAALGDVPEDLRDSTWHYLLDQSDSSIASIRVGKDEISGVAADPRRPGVFAVADQTSKKVILLEARTGNRVLEFDTGFPPGSNGAWPKLAFSPDGERIAVGRNGAGGIVIHSARDGKKLLEWEAPSTKRLEFSPNGKLLLQTGLDEELVAVWDAASGQLRWKYEPEGRYAFATFTPDGQQVVTQGYKDHIRLVNAQDGTLVRPVNNDYLNTFAVCPDGKLLVTGARTDGRIKGVLLQDGKVLFDFRAHDHAISRLAFTPDGARFVSVAALADGRQAIQIWDAETGAPLQTLLGGAGSVAEADIHPLSGELLVAGPSSRVWDLTGTPEKWTLRGSAYPSVAFWGSDDIVFGSAPGNYPAALLKLQAGSPAMLWKPTNGGYRLPSVSADGRFAAIGFAGGKGSSEVLLLRTPGPQVEQVAVFKPGSTVDVLRLNATGDRLAAILSFNTGVAVYDPATGTRPFKLDRKDMTRFRDLGWLSGGQRLVGLVTAKAQRGDPGSEEWIVLWDAATGKVVQTATNRTAMNRLAIAPNGTRFAEAGTDKMVRIHDATTLAVLQEFRAHDGPITALAWHPTKPILATASADLSVKLWNIETGRRLEELRGPLAPPTVLAFSPTGQRLGSAGKDGATRIWEPQSLNEQPAAKQETEDWEDLLATLTPAAIMQTGNGWRLQNGALFSPGKRFATLPLPGSLAGVSYQVRVKLRQLPPNKFFQLELPVADRMVGFALDSYPEAGHYTGLTVVQNKGVKDVHGAVHGQQVKDSEQHDLEVTVRPDGANATITTTLDGQPLYEWTGSIADLSQGKDWNTPPGALALGANAADWVVYEVKVKRLEK